MHLSLLRKRYALRGIELIMVSCFPPLSTGCFVAPKEKSKSQAWNTRMSLLIVLPYFSVEGGERGGEGGGGYVRDRADSISAVLS